MEKRLTRVRSMYQVIRNLLTSFNAVWSTFAAFVAVVAEFDADVTEIDSTMEQQQQSLKGYTVNKSAKKKTMSTLGEIMSQKVRAYASDVGDFILYGKMKLSFTKLNRSRDTESVNSAELIYASANAMSDADKTKFGITVAGLAGYRAAIDDFKELPSPQQVRAIRKQLTAALPVMFKDTTGVLVTKLDNLMGEYKESHPDFYERYFNGRRTYDAVRHTTLAGTAIDETTGADLPEVEVLIVSSVDSFEEMTDTQGKFSQQINPEIDYNAKFIIPGYEPQEFPKINLNRGQHKKLVVKLKKITQ